MLLEITRDPCSSSNCLLNRAAVWMTRNATDHLLLRLVLLTRLTRLYHGLVRFIRMYYDHLLTRGILRYKLSRLRGSNDLRTSVTIVIKRNSRDAVLYCCRAPRTWSHVGPSINFVWHRLNCGTDNFGSVWMNHNSPLLVAVVVGLMRNRTWMLRRCTTR